MRRRSVLPAAAASAALLLGSCDSGTERDGTAPSSGYIVTVSIHAGAENPDIVLGEGEYSTIRSCLLDAPQVEHADGIPGTQGIPAFIVSIDDSEFVVGPEATTLDDRTTLVDGCDTAFGDLYDLAAQQLDPDDLETLELHLAEG